MEDISYSNHNSSILATIMNKVLSLKKSLQFYWWWWAGGKLKHVK
jgi:hypothetical protein